MKEILNQIKAARAIRGYSMEHMASRLGLNYSTYSKIENGQSHLTVSRMFKILELLDLDLNAFFNKQKVKSISTTNPRPQPKLIIQIPLDLHNTEIKDILISFLKTI